MDVAGGLFPVTPIENIRFNLGFVLHAMNEYGLRDRLMVLTALSTIRTETEGFVPIDERVSRFNTDSGENPFNRYDNRRDLGNLGHPDGERYRGRGFVQLTGRYNYQYYGDLIGVPLVDTPTLANRPDIAGQILAVFLRSKSDRIRAAAVTHDLASIRKSVNGGTHGLSRFEDSFQYGERVFAMI